MNYFFVLTIIILTLLTLCIARYWTTWRYNLMCKYTFYKTLIIKKYYYHLNDNNTVKIVIKNIDKTIAICDNALVHKLLSQNKYTIKIYNYIKIILIYFKDALEYIFIKEKTK